jgi:hypothetical protein
MFQGWAAKLKTTKWSGCSLCAEWIKTCSRIHALRVQKSWTSERKMERPTTHSRQSRIMVHTSWLFWRTRRWWWRLQWIFLATIVGWSGDRLSVGGRCSVLVQIGTGVHPPSCKMVTRFSFLGSKRPGCFIDHLHTSSAEVKKSYNFSTPLGFQGLLLGEMYLFTNNWLQNSERRYKNRVTQ